MKFDDSDIGRQLKQTCNSKGLVPVKPVSVIFSVTETSTSVQVERTQFPGTLAWRITVHKAQRIELCFCENKTLISCVDATKVHVPEQLNVLEVQASSTLCHQFQRLLSDHW